MDVGLVCDACDGFNEMGAQACSKCGAALSLGSPEADTRAYTQPPRASSRGELPDPTACPLCGAWVPTTARLCTSCGTPIGAAERPETQTLAKPRDPRKVQTLFFGAMQQARAKLVVIKGDGLDGVSFALAGQEHIAGRIDAPLLFDEDPYLSPTHANFLYVSGKLAVRDEGSVNGVYIRIRGATEVQAGDRFLIGEQVLDIDVVDAEPPTPHPDGTYHFCSPRRVSDFRLVQVLRGGDTGLAYQARSDVVTLGRSDNDINFAEDPFISGHHAQVRHVNNRLMLQDLQSKNGTFLRVNGLQELQHGDYVFMGQQLLRVEIV